MVRVSHERLQRCLTAFKLLVGRLPQIIRVAEPSLKLRNRILKSRNFGVKSRFLLVEIHYLLLQPLLPDNQLLELGLQMLDHAVQYLDFLAPVRLLSLGLLEISDQVGICLVYLSRVQNCLHTRHIADLREPEVLKPLLRNLAEKGVHGL